MVLSASTSENIATSGWHGFFGWLETKTEERADDEEECTKWYTATEPAKSAQSSNECRFSVDDKQAEDGTKCLVVWSVVRRPLSFPSDIKEYTNDRQHSTYATVCNTEPGRTGREQYQVLRLYL